MRFDKYLITAGRHYLQFKMLAIFLWAFASGIPLLLITSTLSARLLQAGVPLVKIGFFAAASLPYSLKFVGSPLVERFSIPILSRYVGRVRSWMLIAMSGVMLSLIWIANVNLHSERGLDELFIAACSAAFCGAISDIAEAELRIELLTAQELALGTACYTNGFCIGELVAGGGVLMLAGIYSWQIAYVLAASLIILGIITVSLTKHQPRQIRTLSTLPTINRKILSSTFASFTTPIKSFFLFSGWYWVLVIILFYYANSYIMLMMLNPFYLKSGFSMLQIGALRGMPSVALLIIGGVLGGILCKRYGILRILFICAIFYLCNILLQASLARLTINHAIISQPKITFFLFVFTTLFVNIIDGISVVAYMTLIASLCHPPFTATQNALLTSLMAGSKIIFSAIAGYLVNYLGWTNFFIFNALLVIPICFVILQLYKMNQNLESIKGRLYA